MTKPQAPSQTWNAAEYARNGRFVADLAGGVFDLLDAKLGEHILDLGCGDGALTARIAAAGAVVTGVDASPDMVRGAQALGVHAMQMSAEALNFDGEFDAVFSNAALHWMRDQDAVLAGVRRALKPGGRFVAEMGGHGNIAAIRVALLAALERHGIEANEHTQNYFFTAESYRERLRQQGFRVEQIAIIPRPTPLPETGMRGWLETFRRGLLAQLSPQTREEVIEDAIHLLEAALLDDRGQWVADYVRLRFRAFLPR
jgi:SAM-dependent methyltransferase